MQLPVRQSPRLYPQFLRSNADQMISINIQPILMIRSINIQPNRMIRSTSEPKVCLKDYQKAAKNQLHPSAYGYFAAGADEEKTLLRNEKAFTTIKMNPRVLVDMMEFSTKTKILGHEVDIPFGVAPVAMQKLVHPLGETVAAKQSYLRKTAYGLSMLSTSRPSQILAVNPTGLKIHQLYLLKNVSYTEKFIKMVEQNGFHALAITVDTQTFGKRRIDKRNKFQPQISLEVFKELGIDIRFDAPDSEPEKSFIKSIDTSIDWESIARIKKMTQLKIILKGVVAAQDIDLAHQYGVDAIWISNHGGRQLDTAPATIQCLPAIRTRINQLKSKMEVYIDGGVWKGTDIFKCLALGADFVFLGRAFLFSLIDGEEGVKKGFDILIKQLKTAMMLSGTTSVESINSDYVIWNEPYSRL